MDGAEYSFSVNFSPQRFNEQGAFIAEDIMVRKFLNAELKQWCEGALSKFPFVSWDRFICTKSPGGPHTISCYGWIDRAKDSYKDFVVVNLLLDTKEAAVAISSSAEYNAKMADLCAEISGKERPVQKECSRIEDLFSIPNVIRLGEHGDAKQGGKKQGRQ